MHVLDRVGRLLGSSACQVHFGLLTTSISSKDAVRVKGQTSAKAQQALPEMIILNNIAPAGLDKPVE